MMLRHFAKLTILALLTAWAVSLCLPARAAEPGPSDDKAKAIGAPLVASRAERRSMIDEDPRLRRTVTLVLRDKPVSVLLAKLTELTAVKLEAAPEVLKRKLTVVGRGTPVVTIMAQVGYLFDWGWIRVTNKDEIAYKLQPKAGLRRRAQSMRDSIVNKAINRAAGAEWEKTQPLLDAWMESRGDIDAIRDADPSIAEAIAGDPSFEYKMSSLADMPPGARYNWIVQQIRAANDIRGPDVAYGIVKDYLSERSGSRRSDSFLDKKISLQLADGAPLSVALQALSKATHLNAVADIYDRKANVETAEWKDKRIADIIESIASDTGYEWVLSGNFVRFRNRTWFLDELRTVPEAVAKRFKDLKEKQGRLTFQDYVELVSSLTDDQLSGLAESGDKYSLAGEAAAALRYLPYFRFFVGLGNGQRAAMWASGGLSMAAMGHSQQEAFLRLIALDRPLTPPYWAPGVFFFARQRGSQGYEIVFSFDVEGRLRWDHRLTLPMPPSASPPDSAASAASPPAEFPASPDGPANVEEPPPPAPSE
ncbi:MAG: hypothetical protein Q7T82_21690 [Armatimonadota bacterium]|nr:hypothetical protein [Armatimonadota bacterium]